jgi:hypothetical protein
VEDDEAMKIENSMNQMFSIPLEDQTSNDVRKFAGFIGAFEKVGPMGRGRGVGEDLQLCGNGWAEGVQIECVLIRLDWVWIGQADALALGTSSTGRIYGRSVCMCEDEQGALSTTISRLEQLQIVRRAVMYVFDRSSLLQHSSRVTLPDMEPSKEDLDRLGNYAAILAEDDNIDHYLCRRKASHCESFRWAFHEEGQCVCVCVCLEPTSITLAATLRVLP